MLWKVFGVPTSWLRSILISLGIGPPTTYNMHGLPSPQTIVDYEQAMTHGKRFLKKCDIGQQFCKGSCGHEISRLTGIDGNRRVKHLYSWLVNVNPS